MKKLLILAALMAAFLTLVIIPAIAGGANESSEINSDQVVFTAPNSENGYEGAPEPVQVAQNGQNGQNGYNGADGANGRDGYDGRNGYNGSRGYRGRTGATGPQGSQGIQGPEGDTGPQGPQGPNGLNGRDGRNGRNAPWAIWLVLAACIIGAGFLVWCTRGRIRSFLRSMNNGGAVRVSPHCALYGTLRTHEQSADGDVSDLEIIPDQVSIAEAYAHSEMIQGMANARAMVERAKHESSRPYVLVIDDAEVVERGGGGVPTVISRFKRSERVAPRTPAAGSTAAAPPPDGGGGAPVVAATATTTAPAGGGGGGRSPKPKTS